MVEKVRDELRQTNKIQIQKGKKKEQGRKAVTVQCVETGFLDDWSREAKKKPKHRRLNRVVQL